MNTEKFWSKVDIKTSVECWEWLGSVGSHGYGQFYDKDQPMILSHRCSYLITNGEIPGGLHVLHKCDNK